MDWHAEYRQKIGPAKEAVQVVQSSDKVFYSANAIPPRALLHALAERYQELQGVRLAHAMFLGDDPFGMPEMEGHFRHYVFFTGKADRELINTGRADYVPIHLHDIPRLFWDGTFPLDVALVMVSPPDMHGYMSFGMETMATSAAVKHAKHVVVQVNEQMPRVLGDCFVHVGEVHAIVEHTEPLIELEARAAGAVERKIGQFVRELIEDGATLQMGIGAIPDAVYECLDGLKNLGIHSEMMSDGAMRAIERGIVTGERKILNPGKVICTFALGSRTLYDFLHDNPVIESCPVEYVNDPAIISQNEKVIAINSALEADLTGQVCAESVGTRIYSGFGGQLDFVRGAAYSKGGKPVIALPSTAKNGTLSRIVPTLKPGAGVVTTRADVHYIVTEYGTARLFGKSLRERAEALIQIAHPDFREELERAAGIAGNG